MPRGPEWFIARDADRLLTSRGWRIYITTGNRYQKGFPDRYLIHKDHGTRWVDYKSPRRHSLTTAQRRIWPEWDLLGVGIWIMAGATETEYRKLFEPPNWRAYWKSRYGTVPSVEELLEQLKEGA
jgi:hypothetical protein